jgi:hypothetical protein
LGLRRMNILACSMGDLQIISDIPLLCRTWF